MSDKNLTIRFVLVLTIIFIVFTLYKGTLHEEVPGNNSYQAGNKQFEDGMYGSALASYTQAFKTNPENVHAQRGIARSLMQLNKNNEALQVFDEVILKDPSFATSYANRGILHDRMQNYEQAMVDYQKALALDSSLAEGPSWLTRFLKNQVDKPSTIEDRLTFLQQELEKPEADRVLQIKQQDDQQQSYKH